MSVICQSWISLQSWSHIRSLMSVSQYLLVIVVHRPGIEPGPPAWQASILPLNHRCLCLLHVEMAYKTATCRHPGYLTKEDSKASEKKIPPPFKREEKKKTLTWWKNVLPCGESNPGRGGESAES